MKKVVLVGSNQLTRHLVDWTQPADFWLFNEAAAHDWAQKCDAVFQMHAPAIWRNLGNVNDAGHYTWLQEPHDFPIWMQEQYPDVPKSRAYPLREICKALLPAIHRKGGDPVRFFTSSPAYAIALAIYQRYDEIEIIGIEMASGTEYAAQLPGVMFWLGIAAGRGVNVVIQDKSLLFQNHLYGYEGEIVIHRQRFEIVANGLEPKLEQAKVTVFELNGKIQQLMNALAAEKSQKRAQALYQSLAEAMTAQSDASFQYGIIAGAHAENRKYIAEVDELIKAAGGERALQTLTGQK